MNNMEIKVGDKVRVSKDAPRIYTPDWVDAMFDLVLKVTEVEDGNAMVKFAKRTQYITVLTTIPTKYLVKVDAEAKEAKFKVGDRVRVCSKDAERYRHVGTVIEVYPSGCVDVDFGDGYAGGRYYHSRFLEPYTEPTEEVNLQDATASELRDLANHGVPVGDEVKRRIKERDEKPNVGSITILVEVDLTDSYWNAYTADLAKEVALKITNKHMDGKPEDVGAYAVSVAKAVVEGLKRK